jgi:hypothetical protein
MSQLAGLSARRLNIRECDDLGMMHMPLKPCDGASLTSDLPAIHLMNFALL